MKKFLLILTCLLTVSISFAQDGTTYVFTSKSWGATCNSNAANWTSVKDGNQFTTNQGVQITTGVTGANANSPVEFTNVNKITIKYCTNKSAGAGTIKLKVGDQAFGSDFSVSAPSSNGTTLKEQEFTSLTPQNGVVNISVECTTNSIYINSITIYTTGPTKPEPEASFAESSYNFDCGVASIFYGPQVNTNSTGAVTYSISPSTASINDNGTEVEIGEPGEYTVTASIAGTDDFLSAEVSYTIIATSSLKGLDTTKTFNFNENSYGMTTHSGNDNNYADAGKTFNLDEFVTLTVGNNCRYFKSTTNVCTFRIGKNQSSTLNVPEGKIITSVEIEPVNNNIKISGIDTKEVTITNNSNSVYQINSITVTYIDSDASLTQTLTIGASGVSTFCTKNALDFSNITNITAYAATNVDDTNVTLTKVEGSVAGNTGLILIGEANATADVPVVETGITPALNLLKPAFKGYTIEVSSSAFSNYIFGKLNNETSSSFHLLTANAKAQVSTGNFAFLQLTGSVNHAPAKLSIVVEGTDGIESIPVDNFVNDNSIYNIKGQTVGNEYKGIIIKNGKKQLIK